jgi:hypothetical protein
MKYLNYFNEGIGHKKEIYFGFGWKEFDPKAEGFHALRIWRKKLSKKGFNCLIREIDRLDHWAKSIGHSYIAYLEDSNGTINYMDDIQDPIIYKKYTSDPLTFASEICENQLDYYNNLDIFPKKEDIENSLYPFTDEGIEISKVEYGYLYGSLEDSDNYDLVQYHRYRGVSTFICGIILGMNNLNEFNDLDIDGCFHEFKMNLDLDNEFKINYIKDTRGLVICIKK